MLKRLQRLMRVRRVRRYWAEAETREVVAGVGYTRWKSKGDGSRRGKTIRIAGHGFWVYALDGVTERQWRQGGMP